MKNIITNGIEMYESLLDAVNKAGGSPSCYTINNLKDMTVMDLISNLSTNRVRFVYIPKKDINE